MAPLPKHMFPLLHATLATYLQGLDISHTLEPDDSVSPTRRAHSDIASPISIQAAHRLVSRATSTYVPCAGCKTPGSINNKLFFALFAILGVAMALASIWFFFWAKNGGFVWQKGDWDDYKSTVLRRRGPDGKLFSNATPSTNLGGGSIVHRQARWAAKSVIARDEKGRKGILGKRGFAGSHSIGYSDNFTNFDGDRRDEMSEVAYISGGHHAHRYRDRDMKEYRAEKVAKVGGMNRAADGSQLSYSDTMTERSTEPLVPSDRDKKRAKLERKAAEEAERMERKWRKEAERAAASLARERAQQGKPTTKPTTTTPQASKPRTPSPTKRTVRTASRTPSPTKRPESTKRTDQRHSSSRNDHRHSSRTPSPQKRNYSFSRGADDASTGYTPSSGARSASYYDAYRPHAAAGGTRSRQSSPSKQSRRYAESEAENVIRVPGAYGSPREKKGRDVIDGYRRARDGGYEG